MPITSLKTLVIAQNATKGSSSLPVDITRTNELVSAVVRGGGTEHYGTTLA